MANENKKNNTPNNTESQEEKHEDIIVRITWPENHLAVYLDGVDRAKVKRAVESAVEAAPAWLDGWPGDDPSPANPEAAAGSILSDLCALAVMSCAIVMVSTSPACFGDFDIHVDFTVDSMSAHIDAVPID